MVNIRLTEAQQQLVEKHLPLVHFVIRKYFPHVRFSDYEDYVQIGAIGLCKAISHYDPRKSKLSTYACWCIRSELSYFERNAHAACRDIRKEICSADEIDMSSRLTNHDTVESIVMANELIFAIRKLPEREMQIIILHMKGYPQWQIAQHLNLSQGHISRLLRGIQQRLREEVCA